MKHSLATGALNALGAQRTKTSTSLLSSRRNEGGRRRRSRSPHISNSESERTTKPTNPSGWRLADPRGTRSAVKQLARMTRGFARQVRHRGKKIFDRSYKPLRECRKLNSAAPHAQKGVRGLPARRHQPPARLACQAHCPPARATGHPPQTDANGAEQNCVSWPVEVATAKLNLELFPD